MVHAAGAQADAALDQTQYTQGVDQLGTTRPVAAAWKQGDTGSLPPESLDINVSVVDGSNSTNEAQLSSAADNVNTSKNVNNTPPSAQILAAQHSMRDNASHAAHEGHGGSTLQEALAATSFPDVTAHTVEASEAWALRKTLTAEESMMQAAIKRLAREDAEEEEHRQHAQAEARYWPASSSSAHAPKTPCPAGFECSDSLAVPVADHVSVPTYAIRGTELIDVVGQHTTTAQAIAMPASAVLQGEDDVSGEHTVARKDSHMQKPAGGRERGGNRRAYEQERHIEETGEDLGESLQHAQAVARQRAEALKAGRRMLTERDKTGNVAMRDQEILRTANREKAHPMYKRAAAAAAAALDQPLTQRASSSQSTSPPRQSTPLQPAMQGVSAEQPHSQVHAAPLTVEAPGLAATVEAGVAQQSSPPISGVTGATNEAAALVKECGLGIGVGAAPHGNWKVIKMVARGSMDRANSSASTRMQVGDILVSVNGASLSGVSVAALLKLVKGSHGSQVTVNFHSLYDAAVHSISVDRICE